MCVCVTPHWLLDTHIHKNSYTYPWLASSSKEPLYFILFFSLLCVCRLSLFALVTLAPLVIFFFPSSEKRDLLAIHVMFHVDPFFSLVYIFI